MECFNLEKLLHNSLYHSLLFPGPLSEVGSMSHTVLDHLPKCICLLVMREIMETHWLAQQTCQLIQVFRRQVSDSRQLPIFWIKHKTRSFSSFQLVFYFQPVYLSMVISHTSHSSAKISWVAIECTDCAKVCTTLVWCFCSAWVRRRRARGSENTCLSAFLPHCQVFASSLCD